MCQNIQIWLLWLANTMFHAFWCHAATIIHNYQSQIWIFLCIFVPDISWRLVVSICDARKLLQNIQIWLLWPAKLLFYVSGVVQHRGGQQSQIWIFQAYFPSGHDCVSQTRPSRHVTLVLPAPGAKEASQRLFATRKLLEGHWKALRKLHEKALRRLLEGRISSLHSAPI